MTVLEIAVFAAVLSGATPIVCHLDSTAILRCSNGYVAEALSATAVRFGNGIVVSREEDQFPVFSTGLTSRIDKAGWLAFGNGVGIRRQSSGNYEFANGLVCISELPQLVKCVLSTPSTPVPKR